MTRWLWPARLKSHLAKNGGHCPGEGGDKIFFNSMWSHDRSITNPHHKSQRLYSKNNRTLQQKYIPITNWGNFVLLQIRANVVINWGSFINTSWGKCCSKLGQLLQISATVITKEGSYYKLGQNVLKIWAGITNSGNYYKLGHNSHWLEDKTSTEIRQIDRFRFCQNPHKDFFATRTSTVCKKTIKGI